MNKRKDILVLGAALFSMFFGAGNLIFPPFLGRIAGDTWIFAIIGFLLTGVGLPFLGIVASSKAGGDVDKLGRKVSPAFAKFLGITIIITIGPLLAIPRTGATAFEMGAQPVFPNLSPIIFAIIFFAINLYFVISPSGVIDKIGKILTPGLFLLLTILIVKGVFAPIGTTVESTLNNSFSTGFLEGYQTMDALAAILFGGVISASLVSYGYTDEQEKMSMTIKAGVVAILGLAFVYGGLGYLGASSGNLYTADIDRTNLIMNISNDVLGGFGKYGLGLAVMLACLTTSVGLTATAGQYFDQITNGKLNYRLVVVVTSVFSAVMSCIGVESIISLAGPILAFMYPIVMVLILLTVFLGKYIKNDNVYKYAIYAALIVSAIESLTIFGIGSGLVNLINKLPLASSGFAWILPALIGGVIGNFIPQKSENISAA